MCYTAKFKATFFNNDNIEACPVCKGIEVKQFAHYRSQSAIFRECSLAKCPNCEMVFAFPMPSNESLDAYNADYFSRAHGGIPTDAISVAFFNAISKLRLDYLTKYIAKLDTPINSVLEYGPGPGFFAKNWMKHHTQCCYFAVETDQSCHEVLQNIGVNLVSDLVDPPVDLLIMSHVLEHVSKPVDFLKNATFQLKSGGVIFIEVPCKDWAHKEIDEPHILFFEKKSMQRLLTDLGFINIELGYFGQPISKIKYFKSFKKYWNLFRLKIIKSGLVLPFSNPRHGMQCLTDPMERAVIAPFRANEESFEPAWWLRVVARKR